MAALKCRRCIFQNCITRSSFCRRFNADQESIQYHWSKMTSHSQYNKQIRKCIFSLAEKLRRFCDMGSVVSIQSMRYMECMSYGGIPSETEYVILSVPCGMLFTEHAIQSVLYGVCCTENGQRSVVYKVC